MAATRSRTPESNLGTNFCTCTTAGSRALRPAFAFLGFGTGRAPVSRSRMNSSPILSLAEARRFARRVTRLDDPAGSVAEALGYHGYIQLDPLNVCGRMHDLILRNRVSGYRKGALLELLHGRGAKNVAAGTRLGFEHYIPGAGILAAWPLADFRFIKAHLLRIHPNTTRRALTAEDRPLADAILQQLADNGPSMSDDFEHEGRARTAWGTDGRLVKHVLEKLFSAGHILICERRDFRRVYDLAERVVPAPELRALPDDEELERWLARLRYRQQRLVAPRKRDAEILGGEIFEVKVSGGPALCSLVENAGQLEGRKETEARMMLLAPLDPLIYDRKRTRALWGFDFTWEVYTPPEVRRRGYYSLPALAGTELVGDVEPRANWKTGKLAVVSKRLKRGYRAAEAVGELASFLGLRPGRSKA